MSVELTKCPTCDGRAWINPQGKTHTLRQCPTCEGTGRVAANVERMAYSPSASSNCSAARPITPEDVVKEADRNYDLGRKHGLEEARPSLAATQRLLLEIAIEQRHHQEWRMLAMRLADESTAVLDNAHWEVKHGSGDLLTTIKAVREKYRLETQMPPNSKISEDAGRKE